MMSLSQYHNDDVFTTMSQRHPTSLETFFKQMGYPGLFLVFFNINTILQQINVKMDLSIIGHLGSNLQPLRHVFPPITTRPELATTVFFN